MLLDTLINESINCRVRNRYKIGTADNCEKLIFERFQMKNLEHTLSFKPFIARWIGKCQIRSYSIAEIFTQETNKTKISVRIVKTGCHDKAATYRTQSVLQVIWRRFTLNPLLHSATMLRKLCMTFCFEAPRCKKLKSCVDIFSRFKINFLALRNKFLIQEYFSCLV